MAERPGRYELEGLFYNLICGAYFLLLSPLVVRAGRRGIDSDGASPAPWLGLLLLGVMALEVYALPAKMKQVQAAIRAHGEGAELPDGAGFFLWMFHAVISIILTFTALNALGFPITEQSEPPWWMALLIMGTVLKELYLLFTLTPSKGSAPTPVAGSWPVDAILVAYTCLAYSATWEIITVPLDLQGGNVAMTGLNLLLGALLFLLFYLPLRIPYFLEEMARLRRPADMVGFWLSIGTAMLPALLRLW